MMPRPVTRRHLLAGLVGLASCSRVPVAVAQVLHGVSIRDRLTTVNPIAPLNRADPQAEALVAAWMCLPGRTAGTRLLDLVGNRAASAVGLSNPATATSGLARVTTRRGGAGEVRCDGTGDYLQVADTDRLSFTGGSPDKPFSLTLWLYTTNIATTQGVLSKWSNGGGVAEWLFFISTNLQLAIYSQGNSAIWIGRRGTLTTGAHQNTWIHVAATYTGVGTNASCAIYINGVRFDTNDDFAGTYVSMSNTTQPVQIGGYNSGNSLNGKLDDVRIYTVALSAQMIRTIYRDALAGYGQYLARVLPAPGAIPVAAAGGQRHRGKIY